MLIVEGKILDLDKCSQLTEFNHANHFIVGNRGNIGKSFFSSLVCHFYSSNSRPFTLFDADPDKQDVSPLYGGVTDVTFDACNEIMVNHSIKNSVNKQEQILDPD